MTNKLISRLSTVTFKSQSRHHQEKRRIPRLCKSKLQILSLKDQSISLKSVLLKNTLKVVEKQSRDGLEYWDSEDDIDEIRTSPGYIESLLNEIDLDQKSESPHYLSSTLEETSAPLPSSSTNISSVLEDFHCSKTFSHNQLISQEDPNIFFEMSLDEYCSTERSS